MCFQAFFFQNSLKPARCQRVKTFSDLLYAFHLTPCYNSMFSGVIPLFWSWQLWQNHFPCIVCAVVFIIFLISFMHHSSQGCGAVRSWRFLGRVRFLTTLGGGVGFFVRLHFGCPIGSFLHHTPKSGVLVEMVWFLLKLVETDFLLCTVVSIDFLTAKFHSFYVKESEL